MRTLSLTILTYLTLTSPLLAVTCGDILSGGVHTLTADLICEGDGPALTVRDGAVLDLGGHMVQSAILVILVEGKGATLQHGIVENLLSGENGIAVQVQGAGGHTITGMNAWGIERGILVVSDHNRLTNNVGAGDFGFLIEGDANVLRRNTVAGSVGFGVFGDGNRLSENVTDNSPFTGFWVGGSQNILAGNRTMAVFEGLVIDGHDNLVVGNQGSGSSAIVVSGDGNRLLRNTAVASEISGPGGFVDEHGDCTHNRWIGNRAAMADPSCILERPFVVSEAR